MKKEYIYIIGGLVLALLLFYKKPIKEGLENMTRGYRNNNFGNIDTLRNPPGPGTVNPDTADGKQDAYW